MCSCIDKHAYKDGVGEISMISDPSTDSVNDVDLRLKLMQVVLVIRMIFLGEWVELSALCSRGLMTILMTLVVIHKSPDQVEEFDNISFLINGFVRFFCLKLLTERFRKLGYGDVVCPLLVTVIHILCVPYVSRLLLPHVLEIFDISVWETNSFCAVIGIQ